jgi:hypothetical protein
MKRFILVALGIVLTTAACNNGSSTSATTAPSSPNSFTTNYAGLIAAPVNGVSIPFSQPFTVGQSGGTVTVILTSASETQTTGTVIVNGLMGLGIGTPSGATCALPSGTTPTLINPGTATSGIQGPLNPGSYCVQVTSTDVSSVAGAVSFSLSITGP